MLQQQIPDWPEPGKWTLFMKTVEDPNVKVASGKVRATAHIMCLVVEKTADPQFCKAMLCSNIDINGLVPKAIVNIASRSAPG